MNTKALNKKPSWSVRRKVIVGLLAVVVLVIISAACWAVLALTQSLPVDSMERRKWSSYEALTDDVYRGDLQAVKRDLDRGVDPNKFPDDGYAVGNEWDMAAMTEAAGEGRLPIIKLLLDRGADPNVCDGWDGTPLAAATKDRVDVMALLVARGAKVREDKAGDSDALWTAATQGKLVAVRFLLAHGANPNMTTGTKPAGTLLAATREGHQDAATRLLRQAGARE